MRRQQRRRYHRRVAFEQDLRVYLERLQGESPAESMLPLRQLDEHELQRHFLARLRELENAGDPDAVKTLFDRWRSNLARFARNLEMLPRQLAPVDRQDAIAFACRVLDEAMNCAIQLSRWSINSSYGGSSGSSVPETRMSMFMPSRTSSSVLNMHVQHV